jgi:L-asparaginase
MSKGSIHHIKTGGTIGGCVPEYPEIERLTEIFPDFVNIDKFFTKSLKIYAEYSEVTICHKDSREITHDDRRQIKENIEHEYRGGKTKFLVTHGTYTMPETGRFLLEELDPEIQKNIQVIITGSMFPWTILGSDAPINVGAALGVLLNFEQPMISICMHGKLFDPRKVTKDAEKLIFKEF